MKNLASLIFIAFLVVGCGGETVEKKPEEPKQQYPVITQYDVQSTWYELPQYFNGIPKYGGILGSYTERHLPAAVSCAVGDFATFSDNTRGNGIDVNVLNLNTGEYVTVHNNALNDAHQNGAIQCIGDTLYLAVATVGVRPNGAMYKSNNGVNWAAVESGTYKAYPQLHNIKGKLLHLYSVYNTTENKYPTRNIYSSCNEERIVSDGLGHYMLSYYDGTFVHVVYNDHPDGFVDLRENLWHVKSVDGCEWSKPELWKSGGLLFLKDLQAFNGKLVALVAISNSMDPTKAEPKLYKITSDSEEFVMNLNHNYTSGVMAPDGSVVFPNPDIDFYAGGSFQGMTYVNYIRRIHGAPNSYFMAVGTNWVVKSDAWVARVDLK